MTGTSSPVLHASEYQKNLYLELQKSYESAVTACCQYMHAQADIRAYITNHNLPAQAANVGILQDPLEKLEEEWRTITQQHYHPLPEDKQKRLSLLKSATEWLLAGCNEDWPRPDSISTDAAEGITKIFNEFAEAYQASNDVALNYNQQLVTQVHNREPCPAASSRLGC